MKQCKNILLILVLIIGTHIKGTPIPGTFFQVVDGKTQPIKTNAHNENLLRVAAELLDGTHKILKQDKRACSIQQVTLEILQSLIYQWTSEENKKCTIDAETTEQISAGTQRFLENETVRSDVITLCQIDDSYKPHVLSSIFPDISSQLENIVIPQEDTHTYTEMLKNATKAETLQILLIWLSLELT